jgi:hypothetical protein
MEVRGDFTTKFTTKFAGTGKGVDSQAAAELVFSFVRLPA